MRIWSIHPRYLDAKGLVALWRESLLAKRVLQGKTKGYKNHPQLDRFKKFSHPIEAIDGYLKFIFDEAEKRGYHFDSRKLKKGSGVVRMNITTGQIDYEFNHLLKKLSKRDKITFDKLILINEIEPHPLFKVIPGKIESWERLPEAVVN